MPAARYGNPWHRPEKPEYGPMFYETDVEPELYRGYAIYRRLTCCWDVVKDGVCVTQLAGPNGARRAIDARIARADNPNATKGTNDRESEP
jgi:hypothetical protein